MPTTLSEGGRWTVYARFTRRSTRRRVGSRWICGFWGRSRFGLGDGPIELGPRKQRAVLAMLALEAGRTVSADRLARGAVGRRAAAQRAEDGPALRVAPATRLLDGDGVRDRHPRARLRAALARRRGRRRSASSACWRSTRPREALALWRGEALADLADEPFAAAEIRRLDELRLRAAETAIDADLAAGRHAEVIAELELLVGGAAAARAPARAADARAVPRGPPVGGAGGLPARRAPRSSSRSASSRAPSCGRCTSRSSRRIRRSTCPRRPSPLRRPRRGRPPRRRTRGLLVAAAAVLSSPASRRSASSVCSSPKGCPGIDEDAVGRDRSGRRPHHRAVPRRPRPGAVTAGAWLGVGREPLDGTVSRLDRARPAVVTIPVGGAAGRARVRRRLAVGRRRRRARRRAGRPGSNKVLQSIETVGTRRASLAVVAGALWVASGVDGRVRRIELGREHAGRGRSRSARTRPRSPPAPARSGWRARRPAPSPASIRAPGAVVAARPGRQRAERAVAVGEGAVWVVNRGDGTLSRVIRRRTSVRAGPGRQRPDRCRGRRRARCGWPGARTEPSCASTRADHACRRRSARAAARPRSRSRRFGVDGDDRPAGGAPRRDAARHPCPTRCPVPVELAARPRLRLRHLDAGLAGVRRARRVPPRRRRGGRDAGRVRSPRGPRRPAADGRTYVFTLRDGAAVLERHAGADRATSARRWSATCA